MRLLTPLTMSLFLSLGCQGRPPDWPGIETHLRERYPGVSQLGLEAYEREHTDALLVDARTEEEYAVSHIPGAVHATTPAAVAAALRIAPAPEVVLYCSVGVRSSALADRLRRSLGVPVFNLAGSIFAWANSGRPLVRDGQAVHEVHPYDERWGRLLDESYHPR